MMAEFSEVIKQFKRMCWYYSRDNGQKSCPICTSYPNCNIGQCRKIAFEKPALFAVTVMRWAAEHPVVYPTWENWLTTLGVQSFNELSKPIPADIAQKLGIEPR
jgi:hypothetical protein